MEGAALGRPGALSAGFDDWFARCVDRDPARRFPDASVAMEALPAPVGQVALQHPTASATLADVPMLIDTGADATLLPRGALTRKT